MHDGGGINMTEPLRLVQTDIGTADVVSHPPLCTLAAFDCPWSMEAM